MPETQDTPPPIRRLLWTKRLLLGLGLLLLTAVVVRLWAGHTAGRRYAEHTQALIDAGYLDASGQPAESAWVDPLDNKVSYFEQAQQAWPKVDGLRLDQRKWWHEGASWYDLNPHPDPVTDSAVYLAALGPVFEAHERMAQAPAVSWDGDLTTAWRSIRNHLALLEDATARAIKLRDFATAARLIRVILETAELADHRAASYFDSSTISNARETAAIQLSAALAYLPADGTIAPQTRSELESIRQRLLTEERFHAVFAQSFIGSKLEYRGYVEGFRDGSIPYGNAYAASAEYSIVMKRGCGRWLVDPVFMEDASNDMDEFDLAQRLLIEHATLETFMDYEEDHFGSSDLISLIEPMRGFWNAIYLPTFERHFKAVASSRMAAAAIAIKLYELDHGRRPDTLAALVPDYLPAVPDDPFLADGQPIQYRPDGVTPQLMSYGATPEERDAANAKLDLRPIAVLYCVGADLCDEGCPLWVDDLRQFDSPGYNDLDDEYFLLDPVPMPLTESVLPPDLQVRDTSTDRDEAFEETDPSDQPQEHDEVEEQGGDEPEQDGEGQQP